MQLMQTTSIKIYYSEIDKKLKKLRGKSSISSSSRNL